MSNKKAIIVIVIVVIAVIILGLIGRYYWKNSDEGKWRTEFYEDLDRINDNIDKVNKNVKDLHDNSDENLKELEDE